MPAGPHDNHVHAPLSEHAPHPDVEAAGSARPWRAPGPRRVSSSVGLSVTVRGSPVGAARRTRASPRRRRRCAAAIVWPVRSRSSAGSSWSRVAALTASLVAACASGAPLASRPTILSTSAANSSSGRDVADQAGVVGLPRGERLGEQRHPHRAGPADGRGDRRRRTAVGHQPDPGEGEQERRGLGGHDEVGGERGRAADAGRHAVDRGHDRLGAARDGPDDPVGGVERADVEALVGVLAGDVGAGAERRSGAGQHDDPHVVAAAGRLERVRPARPRARR